MTAWARMRRRDIALLPRFFFGVGLVAVPRLAQAQPESSPPAAAPAESTGAAPAAAPGESTSATPAVAPATTQGAPAQHRAGFDFLASAGWGVATDKRVFGLELAPYDASFGLDLGYRWAIGVRLGAYVGYSLGHSVAQTYEPLIGRPFDLNADTSSINTGLSVGFDVPLYGFVLRYIVSGGVTVMHTDFGPGQSRTLYPDSSTVGLHVVPGAALLWPHDWFEGGAGFRYLVQVNDAIPSGFLGELLFGVRL